MKTLIKQSIKLTIIIFSLLLIEQLIVYFILQHKTLKTNKNIVVIGDSNTNNAINDSILSNYYNVSKGGTSYVYSYLKLKKIIAKNEHIDTVFLSFAPHQIYAEIEQKWLFDINNMKDNFIYYYSLMGVEEYQLFWEHKKNEIFTIFPRFVRDGFKVIFFFICNKNIDKEYGLYSASTKNTLNEALEKLRKTTISEEKYAETELAYVRKIANLCENNKIKLILLNTPKHEKRFLIRPTESDLYYKVYKNRFPDIEFWDMSHFTISDNGFYDSMHLNRSGAKEFSVYLRNTSKEELIKYRYQK